jgi:hypothetical protein
MPSSCAYFGLCIAAVGLIKPTNTEKPSDFQSNQSMSPENNPLIANQ